MAYITKIHKSKFADVSFREFGHSGPGRYIKFCVYFHAVGYLPLLHKCLLAMTSIIVSGYIGEKECYDCMCMRNTRIAQRLSNLHFTG